MRITETVEDNIAFLYIERPLLVELHRRLLRCYAEQASELRIQSYIQLSICGTAESTKTTYSVLPARIRSAALDSEGLSS